MSAEVAGMVERAQGWLDDDAIMVPIPEVCALARDVLALAAQLEKAEEDREYWRSFEIEWRSRVELAEARLAEAERERLLVFNWKARAEVAEARVAALQKALERIADATELTGDGVLEEMTGPASHEMWARINIARRALLAGDGAE